MSRLHVHHERHASSRIGWLRAAVLGANDGIVSTASLIVGVAAADASRSSVLVAGVAALFAGAMSMAAGEYVSVSSQSDTEKADLGREKRELEEQPEFEREELVRIYESRGIDRATAVAVADQMMAHDALAAHARDELGMSETTAARPLQAAVASALTFTAGAAGCAVRADVCVGPSSRCGFPRLSRHPGSARRTRRRRATCTVGSPRDLLGCPRHDGHCGGW